MKVIWEAVAKKCFRLRFGYLPLSLCCVKVNMETGKKEYAFLWFIENYSYCWHKTGEELVSPEFTLNSLEGTVWNLSLYPRGETDEYKGYISLYLCRSENDAGPENVSLEYELSFLASDGSSLYSLEYESTFEKKCGKGRGTFLIMDEVLKSKHAEYLPQDTLSVRCKIRKGEGKIQPVAQIYVRTRIGIEQISFLHVTENFSGLKPNHTETREISFPSKKGLNLSCSLCLSECSCCDEKVVVEFSPSDSKYILLKCKLSLLAVGKKIECGEIDNRLDATRNNIRKLPLTLTKQVILENKNNYLPDDILSVSCECIFSTGVVEYEKIENTVYHVAENEKPVMLVNQVNINDINDDIYAEQLSACPGALDDFKAIYNDRFLTDVELRTKTKSFPVHKIVLCARSTVFKAMLTNDMKERHTDFVQIDDLEDDAVQELLLFLYFDVLENLDWESAIKLYYAGDKYTIDKLKLLCSSFLVKNLSASNASEVLLLADTHNDAYLKKAVEDFILNHEEQVFRSDEWKSLIKSNPVLVSETMCLKYTRK